MKWLVSWTADKDMNSKWKWSTQLDKKPKRLKKNLKKFRLARDVALTFFQGLVKPTGKFLIYSMMKMTWMEIFIYISHFPQKLEKTTLAVILLKCICISIHTVKFRKWAPGLIFFKGPFWGVYFWRGLYSEGLIFGGKFAFQSRLG